jgi:hypothetical protein
MQSRETEKLGISVAPSGAGIDAEVWSKAPRLRAAWSNRIALHLPDAGPSGAGNFFEIGRFP